MSREQLLWRDQSGFNLQDNGVNLMDFLLAVHPNRSGLYLLRVEEKLTKVGIKSLRTLIPALLTRRKGRTLNSRMRGANEKCFTSDTLFAMREGVLNHFIALSDFLCWAAPRWREMDREAVVEKLNKIDVHNVRTLHSLLVVENCLNHKLKLSGLKCLTSDSLNALRQRTMMVMAYDQPAFEVNVHLISGKLLASLSAHSSMTGTDLMQGITPSLDPGLAVRDLLFEGASIQRSQTLRELHLGSGMVLQAVLCKLCDLDDEESRSGDSFITESDG